jgi:hypothetical protein
MKVNNYKRRLKMNTVKKISTLFALALISQSSFTSQASSDNLTVSDLNKDIAVDGPVNVAYTPTNSRMDAGSNIRSAMQNILQSASVANDSNLENAMQLTHVYGSDIMNSMSSNANAMNSNMGSSYNDSRNTINTTSTDNSRNTNTTNLDSRRIV